MESRVWLSSKCVDSCHVSLQWNSQALRLIWYRWQMKRKSSVISTHTWLHNFKHQFVTGAPRLYRILPRRFLFSMVTLKRAHRHTHTYARSHSQTHTHRRTCFRLHRYVCSRYDFTACFVAWKINYGWTNGFSCGKALLLHEVKSSRCARYNALAYKMCVIVDIISVGWQCVTCAWAWACVCVRLLAKKVYLITMNKKQEPMNYYLSAATFVRAVSHFVWLHCHNYIMWWTTI